MRFLNSKVSKYPNFYERMYIPFDFVPEIYGEFYNITV